ncbi:MAG: hypothetical protein LBJ57_03065, partial [Prevotellaceae bacterium]|nr:hypothetical protein [Prevotellaceae bacterium]
MATSHFVKAQENLSVGGLVSASSYIGDFTSSSGVVSSLGVYVGGLIYYSMSDYYNIRIGLGAGNLRGDP